MRILRAFRARRDARTISRSGLFDSLWYLRRYPDVAAAGLDPLRHYVERGGAEGRFANPIFDGAFYAAHHLRDSQTNPFADYLRRGAQHGFRPNRWFDPSAYAHRRGVARRHAMRHYLAHGAGDALEDVADPAIAEAARRFPDTRHHGTPLGAFLHDHRLVGGIDVCTSWYIRGWTSRVRAVAMRIRIAVDGVVQGDVAPWFARPDVHAATGLEARGFFFAFPRRLAKGASVTLVDEFGDVLRHGTVVYDIPALGTSGEHYPSRAAVAATFLHGRGLEVGAFTQPTDLPPDREILFFDRFATDDLRRFYDRNCGRPMMEPSFVGEAETLEGVPNGTFDFLIANHVVEHLLDPIQFLKRADEILVPGGRAMIAVPDRRYCFDAPRALTPFSHLAEDHARGGQCSQAAHFREVAAATGLVGEAADAWVRAMDPGTIHVHYHVWDAATFVAFIEEAIQTYALPFKLIYNEHTRYDVMVVLEKARPSA